MHTLARKSGRKQDPETRERVIESVLDLVTEGSTLSGLSLVTIAERAGISRNSLYRRWATKDDLYLDVLASINRPLPEFTGSSVRDDLIAHLRVLIERTLDPRSMSLLRAFTAETNANTELHRRYFGEVIAPRRDITYRLIERGIETGEFRPDLDVPFVSDVLVGPILLRLMTGVTEGLDPVDTSRAIVDLVCEGIAPH